MNCRLERTIELYGGGGRIDVEAPLIEGNQGSLDKL
jgi:hypothetical protein